MILALTVYLSTAISTIPNTSYCALDYSSKTIRNSNHVSWTSRCTKEQTDSASSARTVCFLHAFLLIFLPLVQIHSERSSATVLRKKFSTCRVFCWDFAGTAWRRGEGRCCNTWFNCFGNDALSNTAGTGTVLLVSSFHNSRFRLIPCGRNKLTYCRAFLYEENQKVPPVPLCKNSTLWSTRVTSCSLLPAWPQLGSTCFRNHAVFSLSCQFRIFSGICEEMKSQKVRLRVQLPFKQWEYLHSPPNAWEYRSSCFQKNYLTVSGL